MKFVKLFENYFKDKKILDEKYKVDIIDDLADTSDIPTVSIYPIFNKEDEKDLFGGDEKDLDDYSSKISFDVRFDFRYIIKVLNSLKNFENLYKRDYIIRYNLYPCVNLPSNHHVDPQYHNLSIYGDGMDSIDLVKNSFIYRARKIVDVENDELNFLESDEGHLKCKLFISLEEKIN